MTEPKRFGAGEYLGCVIDELTIDGKPFPLFGTMRFSTGEYFRYIKFDAMLAISRGTRLDRSRTHKLRWNRIRARRRGRL